MFKTTNRVQEMEKNIFKISCLTYFTSVIVMIFMAFNPSLEVAPEVLSYMQWWYSQPNSEIEGFVSQLGLIAFIVSLIGVIALFFLQKWGGYLFIPSVLIIILSEWLAAGYFPRSSLEANIDTLASISIGLIFCFFIFSEKFELFKHNKSFKPTPESGAV